MQEVDRLGWAAGLSFTAHGCRVGVRTVDAGALAQVKARLPLGAQPIAGPVVDHLVSFVMGASARNGVARYHLLYGGSNLLARTLDLDDALAALEMHLEMYVAEEARRRLFVHAGVVGWRGRALVLPGRSGSGKTTLVEALVRAGASYYSDEYAVFDAAGRVHPYPRPLRRREDGGRRSIPVEELGGRRGRKPLPLGAVAFLTYRPHARWRPAVLTAGNGLLELMAHTLPARRRPALTLSVFAQSLPTARVLKGRRGEAGDATERLLQWLEEGSDSEGGRDETARTA